MKICKFDSLNHLGLSVNHSGVGRGGVMEPLGGRVGGCDTASGGSLGKKGWRGEKMAGGAADVLRMGFALRETKLHRRVFSFTVSRKVYTRASQHTFCQ